MSAKYHIEGGKNKHKPQTAGTARTTGWKSNPAWPVGNAKAATEL